MNKANIEMFFFFIDQVFVPTIENGEELCIRACCIFFFLRVMIVVKTLI